MNVLTNRAFKFVELLSRHQKQFLLLLIDAIMAPVALWICTAIVFTSVFPAEMLLFLLPQFALVTLVSALLSAAIGLHKIKLNDYESFAILKTGLVAALVAAALGVGVALTGADFPASGIVLFAAVFLLLSVLARVALLHLLRWVLRQGRPRRLVLIYGAGNTGMQLAAALRSHETIFPVAFIDDDKSLQGMIVTGLRVYPPEQIEALVRDREIDRVLLAMPSASAPKQALIARKLSAKGLDVHSLPSFAQLIGAEALVDNLTPLTAGKFLGREQVDHGLPDGAHAYAGKSVLVTGAGGSVGSELCRQLLSFGPRRIVLFDVSELALYNVDRELRDLAGQMPIELVPVLGSVTESRMARAVMSANQIEVVLHAAAYKHVPLVEANPIAGLANNVLGTRTLAEAAHEAGVGRFILISTDKAVRPTNVMGASKRLAELVIQDMAKRSRGTDFSMVRFGNVLGSSGSVIPLFKEQIAKGGPVTLTHEDVTRYFMTIAEAARLVLQAASYSSTGETHGGDVFVLDMGKPVKIRDLAEQIIHASGCTVRDESNPGGDIEITVTGLRPGEKLHEELIIGAGLLTTPHAKILRAQETGLSELEMSSALRALRTAVAAGDVAMARNVIATYVEGFQGQTVSNPVDMVSVHA